MAGVWIVGEKQTHEALKSVFAAGGPAVCCTSAGEARRGFTAGGGSLMVINAPLPDEFGRELAIQAVESGLDVIFLCAAPQADKVAVGLEKYGVLVLPKPLSRQQAAFAVRLLRAGHQRMQKIIDQNRRLTKRLDEARVICQAKCLLALHAGLTEEEAHRLIEKRAMDARISSREAAQAIIRTYGES